jgi:hypothetical protein
MDYTGSKNLHFFFSMPFKALSQYRKNFVITGYFYGIKPAQRWRLLKKGVYYINGYS